ncbi:MAG: glycerophosphodiester phosphodiesterase [Pyrinomonadaceae bacterium]
MVENNFFTGKEIRNIDLSPLIIAHRGASAHAPENTLAALQMAVETQADGVEFDVRLAKDGVPVVIHDATLNRTGHRSVSVAALTSDELNKIDVGSWFNIKHPKRFNSDFASETIPTLTQVLRLLQNFTGLIYIELKCGENDYCQLSKAVCDIISDSPLLPQIIIKSFKLTAISEVKHLLPQVQAAALFQPTIMKFIQRRKHIVTFARESGADQISIHRLLVTRKLVALATEMQMPVTIWTVDNTKWLNRCRKLGIKALITNDPAKMLVARRSEIHK